MKLLCHNEYFVTIKAKYLFRSSLSLQTLKDKQITFVTKEAAPRANFSHHISRIFETSSEANESDDTIRLVA